MVSTKCFDSSFNLESLDRKGFTFPHHLLGHPALELDNLAKVVVELPKDLVFYSSGLVPKGADFDRAHIDHATGLGLRDTIENIRTSNSYVMVRTPEAHPSFRGLFADLCADVSEVMGASGRERKLFDPMLYLFIASPKSITPFHIDRYSTFLFQFQGKKDLLIYPPFDERLVPSEVVEGFVDRSGVRPKYDPSFDTHATRFSFSPGESLHIPFLAPHLVENGADEVSISMSIIWNSSTSEAVTRAIRFNHKARKYLGRLGYKPTPAGAGSSTDRPKAALFGLYEKLRSRA